MVTFLNEGLILITFGRMFVAVLFKGFIWTVGGEDVWSTVIPDMFAAFPGL